MNKIFTNLHNNIDTIVKDHKEIIKIEENIKKLERISILLKDLKNNFIIKSNIIDYNLIDSIWIDFIAKKYNIKHNYNNNIVYLAANEINNSCKLEELFVTHVDSLDEDLIMIYNKKQKEIIYYLKSFQIINKNKVSLPFHKLTLSTKDITSELDDKISENEILISCL